MGILRCVVSSARERYQGWQRPEHPVRKESTGWLVRDELRDTQNGEIVKTCGSGVSGDLRSGMLIAV